MGRIDSINWSEKDQLYFVKDDFGKNIIFDATFVDMLDLEDEVTKVLSLYINRAEPSVDEDLRTCYPAVDRLRMTEEILDLELKF